jgi:hypothetical protein
MDGLVRRKLMCCLHFSRFFYYSSLLSSFIHLPTPRHVPPHIPPPSPSCTRTPPAPASSIALLASVRLYPELYLCFSRSSSQITPFALSKLVPSFSRTRQNWLVALGFQAPSYSIWTFLNQFCFYPLLGFALALALLYSSFFTLFHCFFGLSQACALRRELCAKYRTRVPAYS